MSKFEEIEAYITGRMNAEEAQRFEKQMNSDPALKQEYNLQSEIIEGLKSARAVQLKARLDNVPVGSAGTGGATTFARVATGIAIISAAIVGWYLWNDTKEDYPTEPVKIQEGPMTEEVVPQKEVPVISEAGPLEEVGPEEDKAREKEEGSRPQSPIVKPGSTTGEESTKEPLKEEVAKIVKPEINKPELMTFEEETEKDSVEAPTNTIVKKVDDGYSPLDVEINNSKRKYSFHYQFDEGKLYLYGDFNKELYEIIEINAGNSKSYYLSYEGNFYHLSKKQTRITPLKVVKETSLINKLKEIASNG